MRPSLEVEKELRQMVKDSGKAFEAAAKAALPSPVSLSYSFEKRAVVNSMAEAARAQVKGTVHSPRSLKTRAVVLSSASM